MTQESIQLSIVICTYNRALFLTRLLESIETQKKTHQSYEVLIVDNNSIDDTEERSRIFCTKYSNWRYVFEPNEGITYARNRGWKEARGEYLLYIDDECILPIDYLKIAFQIIDDYCPDFWGGPVYPYFNFEKPLWVKEEYFAHNLDKEKGYLNHDKYLSTCNMGVKKTIMSEVGGFDLDYGLPGKRGQDTRLQVCAYSKRKNISTYFDPDFWVYHQMLPTRMNISYYIRLSYMHGRQYPKLVFETAPDLWIYKKEAIYKIKKIVRFCYQILKLGSSLLNIIFRNRSKYPYWQNYFFEKIRADIFSLGYYWGALFL